MLIDNKTGYTRYYEYGRYDAGNKGLVRNVTVSNVTMGEDGRPTPESLNKVFEQLSKMSGQGGRIEGAYVESDKFDEMKGYAEGKMSENSDPDRGKYKLGTNNCGTFAGDVLKQDEEVKKLSPVIIITSPNSMVKEYQRKFEKVNYDPIK